MNKFLVCIILTVVIGGCGIKKSFQPLPPGYKIWSKTGASDLDVKKTMLECGMASPNGSGDFHQDTNEYYLASLCMESLGFVDLMWTHKERCVAYPDLPACQPGAVIPKPSAERRLNSKYCQYAKSLIDPVEFKQCLKDAANPRESITAETCVYSYKELRAECRP